MDSRPPKLFDLSRIQVLPLERRRSLTKVEDILIPPDAPLPPANPLVLETLQHCAEAIRAARKANANVILMYGAHLLRNGAALLLEELMARGWITHLATNGAGTIHDWEYAFLGRSTESVEQNVATGTFGTWDETGKYIHLAILAGGIERLGYGRALGKFVFEDELLLPEPDALAARLTRHPSDRLSPAVAELLVAMKKFGLPPGPLRLEHRWKNASILAQAFKHNVPLTVHPGIGYDIISNHPMFNGGAIGRAAAVDFQGIAASVDGLDEGVVLSIGSAIMGPQVFEKSLSCVNNVRLQEGRAIVQKHSIFVVDLQDGGQWDWRTGEPPKTNPAYYLRFCKSFSRMGGAMHYAQYDNAGFVLHLHRLLASSS